VFLPSNIPRLAEPASTVIAGRDGNLRRGFSSICTARHAVCVRRLEWHGYGNLRSTERAGVRMADEPVQQLAGWAEHYAELRHPATEFRRSPKAD
jgi:hypothetical protein